MRAPIPILFGAALMLSIGMGLRQSLGLFLQPLTRDLALAVADFTVAIAIQNVTWGILQPIAGAVATRWGFRPLMLSGAALSTPWGWSCWRRRKACSAWSWVLAC